VENGIQIQTEHREKNPAGKNQMKTELSKEDLEAYFVFLDQVREDGKINMFGAAPVLAEVFGLEKREARDILFQWMDTFGKRQGLV
jgi:hypothetical protein